MKKVSLFQTQDGRTFEVENDAKNHEDILKIAAKLHAEVPGIDPILRGKLVHCVMNNVDEFVGIVRSRRARQARAAKGSINKV